MSIKRRNRHNNVLTTPQTKNQFGFFQTTINNITIPPLTLLWKSQTTTRTLKLLRFILTILPTTIFIILFLPELTTNISSFPLKCLARFLGLYLSFIFFWHYSRACYCDPGVVDGLEFPETDLPCDEDGRFRLLCGVDRYLCSSRN